MDHNNEQDLIKKCIKRDRKSQYVFYKKYFKFFYSVCYRYTRSREKSLEMMNLGFAKVMLSLHKYDPTQPLDKWMKTIVINTVIDEFRKSKRYEETTFAVDRNDIIYMVKTDLGKNEFEGLTDVVQEKLDSLNPITKDVFNLYHVDGYRHKEIAKMLNIPEGTCHYHYSMAKKTLRDYLNNEYNLGHTV